ncbi:flagellar basal-body MS-ring and collar protein [Burkholderiales bacterium]|jgi:flagellar M-ring protein FliF|nr:flagellar basal-body MS-ring and collar protein [Burkholderiales bacterium]
MDNPSPKSGAVAFPNVGFAARLSPRSRALLMLGAAGLIAVVSAAWLWSTSPNYGVLFTNVSDRDGGAIIAQLSQMNIPYRSSDGGTILVPSDKVHEARLKLASQGLPKGSVVGFEILESQKFGLTQFQEQLNYQRGLEGELARSIQTLAPVAAARVHLALPKASGFLRDKEPPTASVLLQLHPGQALDRAQIAGIVHLVASSVPELNPKNVSVVDQHGDLLASQSDGVAGLNSSQLDYLAQIETSTIKRIEDILEPIVGRGNVRAQVTADVDFSNVETEDETYKPNQGPDKAAIRSQSSTESTQPGSSVAQGVPGALSNQPPVPATAPINGQQPPLNPPANAANPANATSGGSAHHEQTTNYEIDKNVRHTHNATGQIRRLTAAVVVNNKPAEGGQGAGTPWDTKEIENLQALVRQAMGYNEQRGDSLNLVNAPFSQPELAAVEPVPFLQRPDVLALAKEGGKALLFLLLTAIVVFGVLRPALKSIGTAPVMPDTAAAPAPAPALAPPGGVPPSLEGVRQIAKSDPAAVANVVKAWVSDAKT